MRLVSSAGRDFGEMVCGKLTRPLGRDNGVSFERLKLPAITMDVAMAHRGWLTHSEAFEQIGVKA